MSIRDQIHFRGSSPCSEFVPNMLKPSMCRDCLKLMAAHSSDAVKSDNQIKQALEYMSDKVASKILDESDDLGALFLGGYKSVTNAEFMVEAKITHVVNTAGSLDIFGPHYSRSQKQLKSLGITFHELPLLDLQSFQIDPQLMFNAIHFIWQARAQRRNVLVHCAMGKSRSTTCLLSYLLSHDPLLSVDSGLALVRTRREMAEPNPGFMEQLLAWERERMYETWRQRIQETNVPN
eukprot:c17573_g1_i1.p1 GENE.c17573_g1_i1~~c17573_g1_i1.p1  ORF type:complete len:235 (-),score=38.71 c17573_g1_i1:42-746(-)